MEVEDEHANDNEGGGADGPAMLLLYFLLFPRVKGVKSLKERPHPQSRLFLVRQRDAATRDKALGDPWVCG